MVFGSRPRKVRKFDELEKGVLEKCPACRQSALKQRGWVDGMERWTCPNCGYVIYVIKIKP